MTQQDTVQHGCEGADRYEVFERDKHPSPSHLCAALYGQPDDIATIAAAAHATRTALDALDNGNVARAGHLWAAVDGPDLLARWECQVERWRVLGHGWDTSRVAPQGPRDKPLTRSVAGRVFARDQYRCRYCGIPVFTAWKHGDVVRLVEAFPDATPNVFVQGGSLFGSGRRGALTNRDSAKWLWTKAVADHVFPRSLGGATSLDNLVTACGGCNYGKETWTLEQLRVEDPRQRDFSA